MSLVVVAPDEFAAVVGLPDQIAQRDAVTVQMALEAGGEDSAGRRAPPLGERPEQQPTADFAGGVLDGRQAASFHLRPVVRDIVEILGVGGDLLEQAPSGFDLGQVPLALIFSAALGHQAVGAPDALQSAVRERQIELADEATRPQGGQLPAEFEDSRFDLGRGFAGLVMGRTGLFEQTRGAELLVATQPFAHGGEGGGEEAGGGFDASLPSRIHQTQAMVVSVSHLPHQIVVGHGGGHGGAILPVARRPAPPTASD